MHEILDSHQHLDAILRHMPVVLFTLDNAGIFHACHGKPLRHVLKPDTPLIGQSVFAAAREYAEIVEYVHRALAGMSNRVIADELIMSPATVKWHLEQIYQKLDAHNRCGVVTQAQALGLLPPPDVPTR